MLKHFFLGSAAVVVAVSGSRAADAILLEPEPVEYVRICDAYGAGWWYIPGTETCLKFDGEVRVQYDVTIYHDEDDLYYFPLGDEVAQPYTDETSYHDTDYRARLNVRARNETEFGTLTSRMRLVASGRAGRFTGGPERLPGGHNDVLSASEGPGDANLTVDVATIDIAGFEAGFGDSYWNLAGGFGYYEARFEGYTSEQIGLYAQYTFAANGWTFTAGVEDGDSSGEAGAPDVYGGITYTGGGWYLAAVAYYDSSQSAGAYRLRADYDLSAILPGLALGGWYSWDDGDTDYVKGHVWGVTSKMDLTEELILFGGYSDYADQFPESDICQSSLQDHLYCGNSGGTNWTVGLAWNPVPGLLIQPEYTSYAFDDIDYGDRAAQDYGIYGSDYGVFSLRILRTF